MYPNQMEMKWLLLLSCRSTQHQWQCYWRWSYLSTSSILSQLCRWALEEFLFPFCVEFAITVNTFSEFSIFLQLFLGIIICMMSLHMYFAPPSMLVDFPSPAKATSEEVIEISVDRKTDSWFTVMYRDLEKYVVHTSCNM